MKLCRDGVTREVLLTRRYAFKIPKLTNGWKFFLHGMLANLQERAWWGYRYKREWLCPVVASSRLGLWLVMRRAEDLCSEDQLPPRSIVEDLPCDYKPSSFGWYQGRVVLRDYGSGTGAT